MHNSYTHARKYYRVPFDKIANISQHHQHWRWCTFFKQVYFLLRERKILAILPQIYALISVLSTGLNNAVTYQK